MDGQKASRAVADVARAHAAPGIDLGTMGTRPADLAQLLRPRHSEATPLGVVSDAGPCGSWLDRSLRHKGYVGWGVAPSVLPHKAGDRGNTARREAGPWAHFRRAGALPPVSVPTVAEEALRARGRAREAAVAALTAATCRLHACWRRHDRRSTGPATWGPAHRRGRRDVGGPTPAPHMVLQADVRAVTAHTARRPRLAHALHAHVQAGRVPPVVEALQAWRGMPWTVAVTTGAARGDVTRVEPPRPLMQSRGLSPAADAPGARRRPGAMTQAGHPPARRALVAGAWASRSPANGSRHAQRRRATPPNSSQDLSWNAPGRRGQRDRRRSARGQHATPVVVASARERVGCRWAMAQQGPVTPYPRDEPCTHPGAGGERAGKRRRAGGVSPSTACRDQPASAGLERGRHHTDASQVGPTPRRAAGAPVGVTGSVSASAPRAKTLM